MTTRDQLRRAVRGERPESPPPASEPVLTLPERLYTARERKGVDLHRAERDTKIRARYLAALERGDWKELPGDVYTKGFLRNYALYLGLDPDEILVQWRQERGGQREVAQTITVPRPIATPRKGLTFSPFLVVLAIMTIGVIIFVAYLGMQLLRFAKPPTVAVTDPAAAVVDVDDTMTSYTLRGITIAGATVNVATPGRDPYAVTADSSGRWTVPVDLRRGRNQFDVSALDPETGKHSEDTIRLYITVPFVATEAPSLTVDQPAEGATVENGAIPVQGHAMNATSVAVSAAYTGPADSKASSKTAPAPPKAPRAVTVTPADDGSFNTPLELTTGKWAITVTATNAEGKSTALTRNVTVAFKGVNVVVTIKNSRAWLKVWVDGQVTSETSAAGHVYAPGKVLTFSGRQSVEVRTGKSSATYFTVNGVDLGHMSNAGNPETWLFAPPDAPVRTDRR